MIRAGCDWAKCRHLQSHGRMYDPALGCVAGPLPGESRPQIPVPPPAGYRPHQPTLEELTSLVLALGQPNSTLQHCITTSSNDAGTPWLLWHGLPARVEVSAPPLAPTPLSFPPLAQLCPGTRNTLLG